MAPNDAAKDLMGRAVELHLVYPEVPARQILDELIQAHRGPPLDFGAVYPASPFGLLLAEAFDNGMTPDEWVRLCLDHSDPCLQVALHDIWDDEVFPRFLATYALLR